MLPPTLDGALDLLLSVGWAGSLDAEIGAGTVQVPTLVIDTQTGERFSLTNTREELGLVTTPRVAGTE